MAFSATCCTDRAGCYSDLGCTTCCATQQQPRTDVQQKSRSKVVQQKSKCVIGVRGSPLKEIKKNKEGDIFWTRNNNHTHVHSNQLTIKHFKFNIISQLSSNRKQYLLIVEDEKDVSIKLSVVQHVAFVKATRSCLYFSCLIRVLPELFCSKFFSYKIRPAY